MSNTNSKAPAAIHPFEKAGLGKAPFRFVGCERKVYQAIPGDPSCPLQPGGCCDFCGNGIMDCCTIKSADGKTFTVGNDCVRRVSEDCATTEHARAARAIYLAATKPARERAKAKRAVKAAASAKDSKETLGQLLAEHETALRAIAHPQAWRAARGETLYDSLAWFLANAGDSGRRRAIADLRKAVAPAPTAE